MDNTKYFYRNVIFSSNDNHISLVDINNPDTVTSLDAWLGMVVSLADGEHTIKQMIDYMSKQYREAPANLEETLHSVIERLEEGKIIQLSKTAVSLPYYLTLPIEKLDVEKAKKLIVEDGYHNYFSELN